MNKNSTVNGITLVADMKSTIRKCEVLLEQDIQAFENYMFSLKLPKETEEQKVTRSKTLLEASIQATEIPIRLIHLCYETLTILQTISLKANKNVISDLGIAALLLESSAQSALLTVEINISGMKDQERKEGYKKEVIPIINDITSLKDSIVNTVRERIV